MENVLSSPPSLRCRNIATIAVFYALPVVQLVITYQTVTQPPAFPPEHCPPSLWPRPGAPRLPWLEPSWTPGQPLLCLLQVVNVTGNQDICYYNFLCAHPLSNLR